ncbi:MAG: hypothetical protein HQ592_06780 [Planctomycetes bacterium]|nr:hypothetical protein [Planctomycetota bacterium]
MGKFTCSHANAKFYAVQKFGNAKSIKLYNCPECRSTISEHTLKKSKSIAAASR